MAPENIEEVTKKRDKKRKHSASEEEVIVLGNENVSSEAEIVNDNHIKSKESLKSTKKNNEESELVKRFKENEQFFESCIDLIPTNIYLNSNDRLSWLNMIENRSKRNNSAENFEDDEEDEDEDQENLIKKQKFNPLTFKTVSQIYKELGNLVKPKQSTIQNNSKSKPNETNDTNTKLNSIKIENKNKSKKSLKAKKNDLKENKKTNKKQKNKKSKAKDDVDKPKDTKSELQTSPGSSPRQQKPILNKNGSIVYSKFDFSVDDVDKKLNKKKSKNPTANVKPKDYKKLVQKLQEKKEKFNELKESKPDEAVKVETEDKWRNVLDKASGVKVKDDISLLKKSIKRVEKKKEKSKKEWNDRVKSVEQRQKIAQEKRQKNIDERKQKKKEKVVKRLKKKGRIVTGF